MKLIKIIIPMLLGLLTFGSLAGQTCDPGSEATHLIDFQTDPSGNTLPSGTVIDENTFAEWGFHFFASDPSHPLVLFDSENPTGGDQDLGTPSENCPSCSTDCPGESNDSGGANNCSPLGMILIIEENWSDSNNDGLEDEPDDNGAGGTMTMEVDGKVNISKLSFVDDMSITVTYTFESGLSESAMYDGGADNDTTVFNVNKEDVVLLEVEFDGSGAISEIEFCSSGSIGNYVWFDADLDGVQDSDEVGINGVTLNLYDAQDNFLSTTTTSNHPQNGNPGYYLFDELIYGEYYIQVEEHPNHNFTSANTTSDENDSDVDGSNGPNTTHTIAIEHGDEITNVDIGLFETVCIGNFVWNDSNADGRQGGSENGINDVNIKLFNGEGSLLAETTTTNDPSTGDAGFYEFCDLVPGDFYLEFELPSTYRFSPENVNDDEADSDVDHTSGERTTQVYSINSGENRMNIDAGVFQFACLGNFVWVDQDDDGMQDAAEELEGMNDVKVVLCDGDHNRLDSVYTQTNNIEGSPNHGENGYYQFDSLTPGDYYLSFELPDGYIFATPNSGNDEDMDSDVDDSNGPNTTSIYNLNAGEEELSIDAGLAVEAVPIVLSYFSAKIEGTNAVLLEWQTLTEMNNKEFVLERQSDLTKAVEVIAVVDGAGNSYKKIDYKFVDRELNGPGTYYYRLKQIDYNGSFEYSEWATVKVVEDRSLEFKIYPNPTVELVTINLLKKVEDLMTGNVFVYDSRGKLVIEKKNVSLSEEHTLDLNTLMEGIYYVLVESGSQRFTETIVKLK